MPRDARLSQSRRDDDVANSDASSPRVPHSHERSPGTSYTHTKVPERISGDTGSPPSGVCRSSPLPNLDRFSPEKTGVPALARAILSASGGLSFCLAPYRAPSLRPEPRDRVTGPT